MDSREEDSGVSIAVHITSKGVSSDYEDELSLDEYVFEIAEEEEEHKPSTYIAPNEPFDVTVQKLTFTETTQDVLDKKITKIKLEYNKNETFQVTAPKPTFTETTADIFDNKINEIKLEHNKNETFKITAPKLTFPETTEDVLDKKITDMILEHNTTERFIKYKCAECEKDFSQKARLIAHIIAHNVNKKNETKRFVIQDNGTEKEHSGNHSTAERLIKYKCAECEKDFSQKARLIAHIIAHNVNKKNKTKRFAMTQDSGKEKKHCCYICEYTTDRQHNLLRHLKIHSGNKTYYSCSVCDYKTCNKTRFKDHADTHLGEKLYECTYCTSVFCQKYQWNRHIRSHTKPYACPHCTSKFGQKWDWQEHIRTHTGEKPYACTHCTQKFNRKSNLEVHVRTHTGETLFACTYCTYKCNRKFYLERHMRTHKGEKTYACKSGI